MPVVLGIDQLFPECTPLQGKRIGIVCNQASVDGEGVHLLEKLFARSSKGFQIGAIFGPQHGLFGHTQDNMIEWEGAVDPVWNVPVYSLYGEHRKPTPKMLEGLDLVVFDIQDVGARYYTFIWTLSYVMEACQELGIPVLVLDRPNPLNGISLEGPMPTPGFESFVGRYPLPIRHGMTVGEVGTYLQQHYYPNCELSILKMKGWHREMMFRDTGLGWVLPSPNMPTPDTAAVYPGQCLLEGTMVSEGRGTTRPFELCGAPYLDARSFVEQLRPNLPADFAVQPIAFQPTFHKFCEELCEGVFLRWKGRAEGSVQVTLLILNQILQLHGDQFAWKQPPYEYEYHLMPFDILIGNDTVRPALEKGLFPSEIEEIVRLGISEFEPIRKQALLY